MHPTPAIPSSRLAGLLRDLTNGLCQQMYFLGRDVVHPEGNQLVTAGFEKRPSPLLQGTSCYQREWMGGTVELHGACAGWYPQDGNDGFLFVRPLRKCFVWKGGQAPVPGIWPKDLLDASSPERLHELCSPFLDGWLAYEDWIGKRFGERYREACFSKFNRLPRSKAWLPPAKAIEWLTTFRDSPESICRAREMKSRSRSRISQIS